jgi:hypothetical protein
VFWAGRVAEASPHRPARRSRRANFVFVIMKFGCGVALIAACP